MSILETLAATAGRMTGRQSIKDFQLIQRNFDKLTQGVTDSGAADYIPALTDIGKTVLRSRATAQTLTLPQNSAVAFPIGTQIPVIVTGAGTLTFQAGAGATVVKRALDTLGALTLSRVVATKISTNGWQVGGGLTLA